MRDLKADLETMVAINVITPQEMIIKITITKEWIDKAIKAEAERCIGETECYFNLKNQIEQLQTENALLRKVEEVGEIMWGEAVCHRCEARECRGCSAHDFKKALSEYQSWKKGQK